MSDDPVNPVPPGYPTITPYLVVDRAGEALDFYQRALSAELLVRLPAGEGSEQVVYSEIRVGSSILCVVDEVDGQRERSPTALGGTSATFWIYHAEADALFDRAVAAGCEVLMPMEDRFWGDRMGKLADPFGQVWCVARWIKDMTPDEVAEAARAMVDEQSGQGG